MLDTKQTPNIFKSNIFSPLFCWVCKLTKLNDREMREICWNVLRQKTDWLEQCSLNRGLKRCFLTWEFWSMNPDGLETGGEMKWIQFNGRADHIVRLLPSNSEPALNQDHDLLHHVWPWAVSVCVSVWTCVSEIHHEMVFAGGETDSYRDSGLAWLKDGGGVVVDGW